MTTCETNKNITNRPPKLLRDIISESKHIRDTKITKYMNSLTYDEYTDLVYEMETFIENKTVRHTNCFLMEKAYDSESEGQMIARYRHNAVKNVNDDDIIKATKQWNKKIYKRACALN